MSEIYQGDIIKISGLAGRLFVVVSKNTFIRATGIFHVCPMLQDVPPGPVHIQVIGEQDEKGTVICEQIKAIDPKARGCNRIDRLSYADIMNISDTVQGIFEYD